MKAFAVEAIAVLVVSLACGACDGGPPARTPESASAAVVTDAHRGVVPLSFEAKKSGNKLFPFAFVEGKVGDQPTRFIIDSGAGVHALDTALASAAKVVAPANATSIVVDGWGALPQHSIAVRDLPPSIKAHGIGGIIAPQLLAESGQAIVIDFANHQMRLSPKSSAWSALEDLGSILTPAGQRKPCAATDADGIAGMALAVEGSVDGELIHLAIDTGASRSLLAEGTKGGTKASTHPVLGRTIAVTASSDVPTSIYGGVPFTIGAWTSTVDVGVTAPNRQLQCGAEGRIGMDVLHDCALAITVDEFLVACRAPGR